MRSRTSYPDGSLLPLTKRQREIVKLGGSEMKHWNDYNTPLTNKERKEFRKWAKRSGINPLDQGTYDIQGFWKSGDWKRVDADGHGSDTWKKPNHPTFSTESKYADEAVGGLWSPDGGYMAPNRFKTMYGDDAYNNPEYGVFTEPGRPEYLQGYMLPPAEVVEYSAGGKFVLNKTRPYGMRLKKKR